MSYVVLHADRLSTVLADDPIIPAAELAPLADAAALLAAAGRIHAEEAERGRAEGHQAGLAEGRAAAAAEIRAELFRLTMRDTEERRRLRGDVAALAIEIVRRIAATLGPEATVAALAESAASTVLPDAKATVRVAPANEDAVATRLAQLPMIAVTADPAIDPMDCVVETALGRVHAGLETQLAAIIQAWEAVADAA